MKLQAITMIAALSGLLASTSADAQKFELGKVNKPQFQNLATESAKDWKISSSENFPDTQTGSRW